MKKNIFWSLIFLSSTQVYAADYCENQETIELSETTGTRHLARQLYLSSKGPANGCTNRSIALGKSIDIGSIIIKQGSQTIYFDNQKPYQKQTSIYVLLDENGRETPNQIEVLDQGSVFLQDGVQVSFSDLQKKILKIYGSDYNNKIFGTRLSESIFARKGYDVISTTSHSDSDSYYYNLGDGYNQIHDNGKGVIVFGEGITLDNLNIKGSHGYYRISFKNSSHLNDTIVFNNRRHRSTNNNQIIFHDGTSISLQEAFYHSQNILAGTNSNDVIQHSNNHEHKTLRGLAGDDVLIGGLGDDTLNGGTGNDILRGGKGNDTYLFSRGDGHDTIKDFKDNANDVISISGGIYKNQLQITQDNQDLLIQLLDREYKTTSDSIRILDAFAGKSQMWSISHINLNGQIIDLKGYYRRQADITNGDEQNNQLNGHVGSNKIYGHEGNDKIHSYRGDDILIGNEGDDLLYGGADNDTYVYHIGDGNDTIVDPSGEDTIQFGDGIDRESITTAMDGNDLIYFIHGKDSGDSIRIQNAKLGLSHQTEIIQYSNGDVDKNKFMVLGSDQDEFVYSGTGTAVVYAFGGTLNLPTTRHSITTRSVGQDLLIQYYNQKVMVKNACNGDMFSHLTFIKSGYEYQSTYSVEDELPPSYIAYKGRFTACSKNYYYY